MLRQPKRPDLLVEIAKKMPNTRFVIGGGPSLHRSPRGYGERIIEDLRALPNVEYVGQVPPEKAEQIIADAAVLLSTSDIEGFPNTFTQAWASGTPVVSLTVDPDNVIKRFGLALSLAALTKPSQISTLLWIPLSGAKKLQFMLNGLLLRTVVQTPSSRCSNVPWKESLLINRTQVSPIGASMCKAEELPFSI